LPHRDWIELEDFSEISKSLCCKGDADESWTPLHFYRTQKMTVGQTSEDEYPYRDYTTLLNTLLIPMADLDRVKNCISDGNIPSDLSSYTPHDYTIFFGEYPESLAWVQQVERQDVNLHCLIPGSELAQITNYELLRGSEWEYDCSQDNSENLLVPAPSIIHFGSLKWNGSSGWVNPEGIQVIECRGDIGSALLINNKLLQSYLNGTQQVLLFISYQKKLLITAMAGGESPGIHEKKEFHLLNGSGETIQLGSFPECQGL